MALKQCNQVLQSAHEMCHGDGRHANIYLPTSSIFGMLLVMAIVCFGASCNFRMKTVVWQIVSISGIKSIKWGALQGADLLCSEVERV
eukprot:scaffold20734_cov82-Skeletonema_dohrnii-CCMP3373.AAC.1